MNEKNLKIKELFELALQHHNKNNLLYAENIYKKILKLEPNEIATLNNLGNLLRQLKKYEEAFFYYEKALKIKPQDLITNYNVGLLFYRQKKFEKSVNFFKNVIKSDPKHILSYHSLMDIYEIKNDTENLEKTITEAKKFLKNNFIVKLYEGILLYKNEKFNDAINNLESFSFDAEEIKKEQIKFYTLGKCYDRIQSPDKAMSYFKKANDICFQLKHNNVDKNLYLNEIKKRSIFFSSIKKEESFLMEVPNLQNNPIFMIGFPRSGTTLLDTLLRSHSLIEVIEEQTTVNKLTDSIKKITKNNFENFNEIEIDQINEIRNIYFKNLDFYIQNKNESKIYIDKLPLNIIHVGEIYKIFPKAKFIFSLRHPCDSVLSCFMQFFYINNAMANFLNLEDSAKLYDHVMKLWIQYKTIFPINYYEVRYENLVENLEPAMRSLLKFLELPWEDSILEFYKTAKKRKQIQTPSYDQVTKPIYSHANGRWKLYKKQMKNVYPILKPWIKKFNY